MVSYRETWWVAAAAFLVVLGCGEEHKKPTEPAPPAATYDALPEQAVGILDALEPQPIRLSEVRLPNHLTALEYLHELEDRKGARGVESGDLGPQDTKNALILKLVQAAEYLTNRANFRYPADGPDRPAQDGLAYVYGGKQIATRTTPAYPCCQEQLYGLDCSGLVYQVFAGSLGPGIQIPSGPASAQISASGITALLQAREEYESLYAEELGPLSMSKLESGDLVYWTDGSGAIQHIGVVLTMAGGGLRVCQSNGSTGLASGACNRTECERNRGVHRGPNAFDVSQISSFFGSSLTYAGTVRIQARISGEWDWYLACTGQEPAASAHLTFPTTEENTFQIQQSFSDYDGDPLEGLFEFSYDPVTNVLTCTVSIDGECDTQPLRVDQAAIRLDRDDTGYVPAALIADNCAECDVSFRLVNRETSGHGARLWTGPGLRDHPVGDVFRPKPGGKAGEHARRSARLAG